MTFTDAERAAWFPPNPEGQKALDLIRLGQREEAMIKLADLNRRISESDSWKERDELRRQKLQWSIYLF